MTTRNRVSDSRSLTVINFREDTYDLQGNYTTVLSILPANYTGERRSMSDTLHPFFKKRSASGEVILGDMSLSVSNRNFAPGAVSWWNPGTRKADYYDGDFAYAAESFAPTSLISSDISKMRAVALVKAFAKANSPAVLSGEIMHDLDQTLSMLRKPFSGSRSLLKRMFKSRNRYLMKGVSLLKANANAWLEYRYGWKPLMLDAESTFGELERKIRALHQRLVARSGQFQSYSSSTVFTDRDLWPPSFWRATGHSDINHNIRVNSGVIYDVHHRGTADRMASSFGARASDMPSTFWEIIPYSFVVDWFVDVGDWIQATTPVADVTHLGNWTTVVEKKLITTSITKLKIPSGTQGTDGSGGSSSNETTSVYRTVNDQLPTLPVQTVGSLSALHSADGLSLLTNRILGELKSLKH